MRTIPKVAIDTGPLTSDHKVRGIGVMTKELIEALGKNIEAVDFSKTDLSKYDVVHYPYFHPHFLTLPKKKPSKKVIVTIHDLILLIYPKQYPPGVKGKLRFLEQKRRLKSVDAIITISETSKKDIVRFLRVNPDKIHVIYLAPKKIFKKLEIRKRYNLPKHFVLYVGDVNYNKNILGLTKACLLAKLPLVIVGKQAAKENFDRDHPENRSFAEFLNRYQDDLNIIRLGFVPDEDLVAIYNLATVYCQPSFYEGFGLPVLEAMACGTPVVASRIQAHVEVAGSAAIYANPKKPKDLADKIKKVVDNNTLREKLIKKGSRKAKEYSWRKAAKKNIKIYSSIVSSR